MMPNFKSQMLWVGIVLVIVYAATFGLVIPGFVDEVVVLAVAYFGLMRK